MSDTRTYYAPPDTKPGDSISWGSLSDTESWRDYDLEAGWQRVTGVRFTPIPYCTFGDYDGSTAVERSNARVFRERFPELVHVTGDYGSEMVGYLGEPSDELVEAISKLDGYPVADEGDMSELENEMEWEAWCDWGRRDFARELEGLLDTLDPGHEHEVETTPYGAGTDTRSPLDTLWHDGAEWYNLNGGPGYTIEGGGGVYFYISDWVKHAERDPSTERAWSDTHRTHLHEMRGRLLKLAEASRLPRS